MTRARSERSSIAMSAHSTAASRSTFASIRSASRWRCSARPFAPSAAQAGNASFAAATASSASRSPPRATSASGCASIGERSVKVASLATRSSADEVLRRDGDTGDVDPALTGRPAEGIVADVDGSWPPSTVSTAPLTSDASSESSQATIAATSSGRGPPGAARLRGERIRLLAVGAAALAELVHLLVRQRRPHPAGTDAVRTHAVRPVIECDARVSMDEPALDEQYASRARARHEARRPTRR